MQVIMSHEQNIGAFLSCADDDYENIYITIMFSMATDSSLMFTLRSADDLDPRVLYAGPPLSRVLNAEQPDARYDLLD